DHDPHPVRQRRGPDPQQRNCTGPRRPTRLGRPARGWRVARDRRRRGVGEVMNATTHIEWTDRTWNPLTGCTKVTPGCDHCYAKTMHERFNGPGSFDTVTLHPERLDQPLRWRKPSRVFVNSMSDLFHQDVPDEFIARVFAVMTCTRP